MLVVKLLLEKAEQSHNRISQTRPVNNSKKDDEQVESVKCILDDDVFDIEFFQNETVTEFRKQIPLTLTMNDLHDNEKFAYLSQHLPVQSEKVGYIEKGDILLFGSNCLVLFYQSIDTNYAYTKIGKIKNPKKLDNLKGAGTVNVSIQHHFNTPIFS